MTKVLIIRFSSIGDIVLCTPIVRCMKQQLGTEIHFLTKSRFKGVLENNPYIDEIIAFEDLDSSLELLRSNAYDYVIDLHNNLRSSKVCKTLGVQAFKLDKINIAKWMLVNIGLDKLPNKHIVDRKFDAIQSLGVEYDGEGLDYFFETDEDLLKGFENRKRRIGIVLGAAHYTKRIPLDLVKQITEDFDAEFFLLGGPAEQDLGEQLFLENKVYNWCGKTSLQGSAQLMDTCDLIISSDTGLMHIAAALDKPIITVWGSTVPTFGMYPFIKNGGNKHISQQVEGLHCRPCSKIGYNQCPKGHFACMVNQKIEKIRENINIQLSGE